MDDEARFAPPEARRIIEHARAVACPTCGADVEEWCRRLDGKGVTASIHRARHSALREGTVGKESKSESEGVSARPETAPRQIAHSYEMSETGGVEWCDDEEFPGGNHSPACDRLTAHLTAAIESREQALRERVRVLEGALRDIAGGGCPLWCEFYAGRPDHTAACPRGRAARALAGEGRR